MKKSWRHLNLLNLVIIVLTLANSSSMTTKPRLYNSMWNYVLSFTIRSWLGLLKNPQGKLFIARSLSGANAIVRNANLAMYVYHQLLCTPYVFSSSRVDFPILYILFIVRYFALPRYSHIPSLPPSFTHTFVQTVTQSLPQLTPWPLTHWFSHSFIQSTAFYSRSPFLILSVSHSLTTLSMHSIHEFSR